MAEAPDTPPGPTRGRLAWARGEDGRRLVLLALCSLLAVVLGFVAFDPVDARWIVRNLGFGILWVTVIIAAGTLWAHLAGRRRPRGPRRDGIPWRKVLLRVAYVAFLTALLHVHFPHRFKVLEDEVVLLGLSLAMHKDRDVFVPSTASFVDGAPNLLKGYIDKRPYLYPFVVSIVHDLTGFRPHNGIWLNAALTPVLLWLVFLLGGRVGGVRGAYLAPLLLAGLPLLGQNVTGGGFEVLNLVLLAAVMLLGMDLLRDRRPATLAAFASWGGLLAFCRYESVLYVVSVGAVVLLHWWRERRPVVPWTLCAVPLLLVPFPLIMKVVQANLDGFFQLSMRDEKEAFSPSFLVENLASAADFFFHGEGVLLNSTPLFVGGAIGLVAFVILSLTGLARRRVPGNTDLVILAFGAIAAVNLLILLCYHWGQLDDPIVARISLPHHLFLALGITWLVRALARATRLAWRGSAVFATIAMVFTGIPASANHDLERIATPVRIQGLAEQFVARHPTKDYAVITRMPIKFITQEVLAYPFKAANASVERLARIRASAAISDIFVMQEILVDPETFAETVSPETALSPRFALEPLSRHFLAEGSYLRFSRVVGILPEPAGPPAAETAPEEVAP